ncbi:N-acetylglucosamine-1-phosphotransferase subunits alpha/beta-like isoform X1 [Lytechinus variegatus]|uniref:N-acetylglucosamine-1-phosphotransferase subunits alpha/beta-like isoform X1 n=1 Tax=Lytechinus variegatus TaxID=7654 RepID=UPI001BB1B995|nr:N-acetylglucosamine-1-phosphotransferase subunits alpha/beta-like isoform X1 [Lytechinus variegatus]
MFKIVQKQTYTFLSHRYGVLLIFSGIVLVIVSAFQFGEVAIEWSQDRYSRLFNIYHDNIANTAFENRMCLPIPIDAVYTWVNGSDPKLLKDLELLKKEIESSTATTPDEIKNSTSSFQCRLKDCIASSAIMTSPFLDKSLTISQLSSIEQSLRKVNKISNLTKEGGKTNTMLQFSKREEVEAVMKAIQSITLNNKNYTLSKGYITSDWTVSGSVALKDRVLVTGVEKDTTEEQVKNRIAQTYQEKIGEVLLENVAGLAIVFITDPDVINDLISDAEKTNTSSSLKVNKAYLAWNMEHEESKPGDDFAPNRFEDNEELRYSLRSLEKHAPWIRRVYVVTNGQIPSWLNLDNPRLILVSHDEIFVNKSHLPTFSSPAIESHLHRIPGLSKKFIYLNDDTMFGKDIWPDDFYTHASGQKVYLTWPVPNCAEGCPSSWIKDNYCDKACNNSECEWDGGDCKGVSAQGPAIGGGMGGGTNMEQMYCNTGCANGWIADKYCDQACNVPQCGFDAGDCGKTNLHSIYSVLITGSGTQITLPRGLLVVYFNATPIFGEGSTITEGKYDNHDIVRTATIAQKFKTIHLLLYKNMSESVLTFHLSGKTKDDSPLNVTFNVTVNTKENKNLDQELLALKQPEGAKEDGKTDEEKRKEEEEPAFEFEDISEGRRGPKLPLAREKDISISFEPKEEELTDDIANQLKELSKQLEDGDITKRGHDRIRSQILAQYLLSQEYTKRRREVAQGLHKAGGKQPIIDTDAGLGRVPDIVQQPGQGLGLGGGQGQGQVQVQGQVIGGERAQGAFGGQPGQHGQGVFNQQVIPQLGQGGQAGQGFRDQVGNGLAGKQLGQGQVFKDTDVGQIPRQRDLGQGQQIQQQGAVGQGFGQVQGQFIDQQMGQGLQAGNGPVPVGQLGEAQNGGLGLGQLPLGQAPVNQNDGVLGQLPGQMPGQPQDNQVFRNQPHQGIFQDKFPREQNLVLNNAQQQMLGKAAGQVPQGNTFAGIQQGFNHNGQPGLQNVHHPAGGQNFGDIAKAVGNDGALRKEADAFDNDLFGANIYKSGKTVNQGQVVQPGDKAHGGFGQGIQPGQQRQQEPGNPLQGLQAPVGNGLGQGPAVGGPDLGQGHEQRRADANAGENVGQGLHQGERLDNQLGQELNLGQPVVPFEQNQGGQGHQPGRPLEEQGVGKVGRINGGLKNLGDDNPLGLQQGIGMKKQDPKLEETREKYKHFADKFEEHKGNQINQGIPDVIAGQGNLNQPMGKENYVKQPIGGQKQQVVFDAKPLAGVGQDLEPMDDLDNPLGKPADLDQPVIDHNDMNRGLRRGIDSNQQVRKVDDLEPPVNLHRDNDAQPIIEIKNDLIQNGINGEETKNRQLHEPDQLQDKDGLALKPGNENDFMDNDNVGNLLKEQNNLPFQIPDAAEVDFEDDRNPSDDAGDVRRNDRGFRKLLSLTDKEKVSLDSAADPGFLLFKDPRDVLKIKSSWVTKAKHVVMRITSGFLDHEIQKKVVPADISKKQDVTAYHELQKWSGGMPEHPVFPQEGNELAEEAALRQKKDQDRKSSFLPWERTDSFNNLTKLLEQQDRMEQYSAQSGTQRRLLDTFGDSLRHVNKLFNKKFGYQARKVPAHMPHMVDVGIMNDLQAEFEEEYDITSSHRLRHSRDMQHAFSYFYYLMGTPKIVNVTEVFDEFDTDGSGVLSDREIRTLATRLYELPLDLKTLTSLEGMIIHCAVNVSTKLIAPAEGAIEKYYEEKMPQVTKDLLMHCPPLIEKMQGSVKGQTMYKYEIMGEEEIAFKMIQTNVSQVIGQLDDIRKHPKKFVCLNDNIDHKSSDAYMVKAVLQDFYESLFPVVSQFELPRDYRNRFLHIDELRDWRRYRDWLRFWTHLSLAALITFSAVSFCSSHLLALKRRCFGRRRWRGSGVAETVQHV